MGCATQKAYRSYSEAKEAYRQAYDLKPGSLYLKEALIDLEAGKTYLDEARYDRALDNFEKSMIRTKAIVETAAEERTQTVSSPTPIPEQRVEADEEIAQMQKQMNTPAAIPKKTTEEDYDKRGLPRAALARYLSGKREGNVKTKAEVLSAMDKSSVPRTATKASTSKKEMKASDESEKTNDEDPKFDDDVKRRSEKMDNEKNNEVIASAKPQVRADPKAVAVPPSTALTDELENEVEAVKKEQQDNNELSKRKIPGKIPFVSQDPSLQPEAMGTLNQISKYLLENPSTTLFLKGTLASKEADSYVDARYESIRSYLTGKGVPEDQVRLDDNKDRGKIAEFEMYLVEH